MRKLIMAGGLFIMTIMGMPAVSLADPGYDNNRNPASQQSAARINALMQRLEEIKEMDKSTLSREDKRELRREVRSIRREMKVLDEKVYLSVGAIIIILLILILLLK